MMTDLPLADYDELPLGVLRSRIRSLDIDQLRDVVAHEREHGNRVPVLEVLEARLEELEQGAEPAPGDPENAPGVSGHRGGSPASTEQTDDRTPLRHGVAGQTPRRGRD
jgi:hypothetical protein